MKYRARAKMVEAMQWDGGNGNAISKWALGGKASPVGGHPFEDQFWIASDGCLVLPGKLGLTVVEAKRWDYIVKSAKGELSVMSPKAFEATYEDAML